MLSQYFGVNTYQPLKVREFGPLILSLQLVFDWIINLTNYFAFDIFFHGACWGVTRRMRFQFYLLECGQ